MEEETLVTEHVIDSDCEIYPYRDTQTGRVPVVMRTKWCLVHQVLISYSIEAAT